MRFFSYAVFEVLCACVLLPSWLQILFHAFLTSSATLFLNSSEYRIFLGSFVVLEDAERYFGN